MIDSLLEGREVKAHQAATSISEDSVCEGTEVGAADGDMMLWGDSEVERIHGSEGRGHQGHMAEAVGEGSGGARQRLR